MRGGARPGTPKVPYELRLPNEGSEWQTPTTLQIDLKFAKEWQRMNWERFTRLCNFLRVTAAECASMVGMRHADIAVFERRNRVMQGRSPNYAAAHNLTVLELHCCSFYTQDVVNNQLPDLNANEVKSA